MIQLSTKPELASFPLELESKEFVVRLLYSYIDNDPDLSYAILLARFVAKERKKSMAKMKLYLNLTHDEDLLSSGKYYVSFNDNGEDKANPNLLLLGNIKYLYSLYMA